MKERKLSALCPGTWGAVISCGCGDAMNGRLADLGLIPGARIRCLHRSPSGSPCAYEIQGAVIALRRRDAENILVEEMP